jgi:hypothetical protein
MPKQEIDIKSCYGKSTIFRGIDNCPYKRSECPWGEACLSASNEEWENSRYHKYQNVSLGNVYFDPSENPGDKCKNDNEKNALLEVSAKSCEMEPIEDEADIVLENLRIPDESYDIVLKVLEAVAGMYFDTPSAFECMMKKIYLDKRQADVAKEKNMTRQGLNKRLLHELGIAQKRNDVQKRRDRELKEAKNQLALAEVQTKNKVKAFCNMTDAEFAVYKLCAEDGCLSISAIAKMSGYTRKTIRRSIQNLRSKHGISIQLSPYARKKNE